MVVTKEKNWRWEDVDKNSISLTRLAQYFDTYNRSEGKSPKTLRWYNQVLQNVPRLAH